MKVLLNNTSLFKSLRPFNDLGFVPTMGGIHEGHLSLINKSNKLCKKTIVSIFINPKQFNNKKDLKSYPRNLKKDLKLLDDLLQTNGEETYLSHSLRLLNKLDQLYENEDFMLIYPQLKELSDG